MFKFARLLLWADVLVWMFALYCFFFLRNDQVHHLQEKSAKWNWRCIVCRNQFFRALQEIAESECDVKSSRSCMNMATCIGVQVSGGHLWKYQMYLKILDCCFEWILFCPFILFDENKNSGVKKCTSCLNTMQSNKWLFIYFLLNGNVLIIVLLCRQNTKTRLREKWKHFYKSCLSLFDFNSHACIGRILNSIYMNMSVINELKWVFFPVY